MKTDSAGAVQTGTFEVNGRSYSLPSRPVVTICIDGCADEYLTTSIAHGCMPTVAGMAATGYRGLVRGALPSFTNVNNAAIATGLPPSETGISGNFFLDPESGEEVMMNSADYLRTGTVFAAAARAGRKVAVVTAKEKLRDILSKDLQGIAFSAEKANEAQLDSHGIEDVEKLVGAATPEIYRRRSQPLRFASGRGSAGTWPGRLSLPLADRLHAAQVRTPRAGIARVSQRHGTGRSAGWLKQVRSSPPPLIMA